MEFIAYDKEKKEWVEPVYVFVKGNGEIGIFGKPFIDSIRNEPKDITTYPYIGRTDKDGDKIYEGSLVEYERECIKSGVVFYSEEAAAFLLGSGSMSDPYDEIGDNITNIKLTGHIAEGTNVQS